jgi:hypothetical protein
VTSIQGVVRTERMSGDRSAPAQTSRSLIKCFRRDLVLRYCDNGMRRCALGSFSAAKPIWSRAAGTNEVHRSFIDADALIAGQLPS